MKSYVDFLEESKKSSTLRTSKLFSYLILFQWIAVITFAIIITPKTWKGAESSIHIHIWLAIVLGTITSALPLFLLWKKPLEPITKHVVAISVMVMAGIFIHITGGRIESHFHLFGVLAVLSFYRDWKVLITATLVTSVDHFVRGIWFPISVYGVEASSPYRVIEHALHVVFQDTFLILGISHSLKEMTKIAKQQAENQSLIQENLETEVLLKQQAKREQSLHKVSKNSLELTDVIQIIHTQSKELNTQISQLKEAAGEGESNMENSLAQIKNLSEITNQSSVSFQNLSQSTGKIKEITNNINELADKTNLLALNATIEAARAGEHGKGFAIVAHEVKELANQTKKFTTEIQEASNTFTEGIRTNEALINTGCQNAETGFSASKESQDAFHELFEELHLMADKVSNITSTTDELFSKSQLISKEADFLRGL